MTINELAHEFEITRRQVYRDLERLEEEGHPLTLSDVSGERSWQLPLGYKGLQPITLSPYELMSLQLARSGLAYLEGTPFLDDLDQTLAKIRTSLPEKTSNHWDRLLQVFTPLPRPLKTYGGQASLLRDLRKALLLQLRVELEYRKPGEDELISYRIDPYTLALYKQGLYVTAYSHTSGGDRLFLVDRMKTIQVTDERFDLPANFAAAERFTELFGLVEEAPQDIVLHASADVAHFFRESQWHSSQQFTPQDDGSLLVTFRAGGLEEISQWVLSWGKEMKVLGPPELVAVITEQLAQTLHRYTPR